MFTPNIQMSAQTMPQSTELLSPYSIIRPPRSDESTPIDYWERGVYNLTIDYRRREAEPPISLFVRLDAYRKYQSSAIPLLLGTVDFWIDYKPVQAPDQSLLLTQYSDLLKVSVIDQVPKNILLADNVTKHEPDQLLVAELVLNPGYSSFLGRIDRAGIHFDNSRVYAKSFFGDVRDAVSTLVALNLAINRARRSERRQNPIHKVLTA